MGDTHYCETAGDTAASAGVFDRAALYWAKDCDKYDDSEGCGKLGLLLMEGQGVDRDEAGARALRRRLRRWQRGILRARRPAHARVSRAASAPAKPVVRATISSRPRAFTIPNTGARRTMSR